MLQRQSLQQGIDWKVNLGVAVLGMVLLISLRGGAGFPDRAAAVCAAASAASTPLPLLYFVAIGLGYILVEIAFIQRFVLFLGHPTYALTVVVFLLLLSSGAGSLVSRRWLSETAPRPGCRSLLIVAALLLYVFVLPGLLNALVGLPFVAQAGGQRRSC